MRAAYSVVRAARRAAAPRMHVRFASSLLKMPAMSPTMTEGGIAGWKVEEGQTYSAGDVILEIETDKATIDVEAQDDGVMGKILLPAGSKNVPVGETIAVLAEEGDDLSKLEVPKDLEPEAQSVPKEDAEQPKETKEEPKETKSESESQSQPQSHSKTDMAEIDTPMFPAAARLIMDEHVSPDKVSKMKGTGKHGILTRGDVLAALGKIPNPWGSAEKMMTDPVGPNGKRASEKGETSKSAPAKAEPPLDGPAIRRLIAQGLTKASAPMPPAPVASSVDPFDDLLADYAPLVAPKPAPAPAQPKDDLSGLF